MNSKTTTFPNEFALAFTFPSSNPFPLRKHKTLWKMKILPHKQKALYFRFSAKPKHFNWSPQRSKRVHSLTHSPSCWKEEQGIPETTSDWAPEESWCTATSRSEASPATSACTSPSNSVPTRFDSDPRIPQLSEAPSSGGVRRSWWRRRPLWGGGVAESQRRSREGEKGKRVISEMHFLVCVFMSEMLGEHSRRAGLLSWLATLDGPLSLILSLLCHFKPFFLTFFLKKNWPM